MSENQINKDLTADQVVKIFLESYLKDGVLSSVEISVINSLRKSMVIPEEKFNQIKESVKERFKNGEIEYLREKHSLSNKEIYRNVLIKAYEDRMITPEETQLILKVAGVLKVTKSQHSKLIKEIKEQYRESMQSCMENEPELQKSNFDELEAEDVFRIFFEEYFKDGDFDETEKKKMQEIRAKLSIENDNLKEIMKEVIDTVRKSGINSEEISHEENNLIIFRRILKKAFSDREVSVKEEKIISTVAHVLKIPDSELTDISGIKVRNEVPKKSEETHKQPDGMEHKGQKKVTVNDLNALYKKGLIDRTALSKGTELIRPASKWYEWAQLNLLLLGSTLLLVGIIFFFAYNWNDIGRFMKFSVIEVSIIGCILGAFRLGIDEISSKALLTSASVLVGVLLAVFGQTYQTGADPYELFAGWAILIFGWVLVTEFAQLWTLWIVLINTGVILYWMQVLSPVYRTTPETLFVAIGLLNLFFMGIKEIFCRRGNKWLKATWLNHLLLLAVLVSVTIPTSMFILFHRARERFNGLGPVFWILIISGGFYYYRYVSKEIEPLSMIIFCQSYVLLNILFKFFFNSASRGGNAWIFFTFGWIIIGVIALAVYWIKILAKELNNKRKINHV